jgi:UDP-N-acetyl-D-glucosamine dehydrogenase
MNNVAVIGLGYVGLPLVLALLKARKKVVGFDLDNSVVKTLNRGECHLPLWEQRVKKEVHSGENVSFTTNPDDMSGVDAVIICVPTPLNRNGKPDHSHVTAAMKSISQLKLLPGLIILESTVSPGYTREIVNELFGSNLASNNGVVHVCFSPEREDPGNEDYTNVEIPKVIGGLTPACLSKGSDLYMEVFEHIVRASSLEAAELCKLHENTFRAVNITYVNQFRDFSAKLGINFEEVVNLAKSKPFGFMPFTPGIGVGGHCIPIDPHFLLAVAEKKGTGMPIVRDAMADICNRAKSTFEWLKEQKLEGDVLVTGASYKDSISDTRCSPAIELIELLSQELRVFYWDHNVSSILINGKEVKSISDSEFRGFIGTIVVVNQSGKSFCEKEILCAAVVLDARYRIEL